MADADKIRKDQLEQIENDLEIFYDLNKQSNFTSSEIKLIYKQLGNFVKQKNATFQRTYAYVAIALIIFAIIYKIICTELFFIHATAVSRILLIKLLPLWNWNKWHMSKCLITSSVAKPIEVNAEVLKIELNCAKCESVQTVFAEKSLSAEYLKNRYLDLQEPVIITNWPDPLEEDFKTVANILNNDLDFVNSSPCELSSNLISPIILLSSELLIKASDPELNRWFFHFRNCDSKAFKAMRLLFNRKPTFFSHAMPPSHTNWLIANYKYFVSRYKKINIKHGVLVVLAQLKGSNEIELRPIKQCEFECKQMNFPLFQGESLIFDSTIWELYYRPNNLTVSVAVVSEIYYYY